MKHRDDDEEDETSTLPPFVLVHVVVEKEKQDDDSQGGPRPNAYWQRIRESGESEPEPDTFGGGFRGVPAAPHGGAATVRPEQVIGSDDLCWCGLAAGHDWPGKDKGRKHPKEGKAVNTMASTTVDRRDLRAYHARLQDFVMQCVNEDRLRFRIGKNSVILYPPDSTNPATVYARNSDRQIRQLQKWYVAHVYPHLAKDEEPVEESVVEKLAKTINDPVEHPREKRRAPGSLDEADLPRTAEDEDTPRGKDPDPPLVAPPVEGLVPRPTKQKRSKTTKDAQEAAAVTTPGEWVPYVTYNGDVHERIEMDGLGHYRCRECLGTDHEYLSESRQGIGGHNRIYHTDTSTLWNEEVRSKAVETGRLHKAQKGVIEAIEALMALVPGTFPNPSDMEKMEKELAKWQGKASGFQRQRDEAQAKLAALQDKPDDSEALAAAVKRAEDAETKLALMKEAFRNLE